MGMCLWSLSLYIYCVYIESYLFFQVDFYSATIINLFIIYQNTFLILHRNRKKNCNIMTILKFAWKHKRSQKVKIFLFKETKAGGFAIPDLKMYLIAIAIKQYGTGKTNRHVDQWNKIVDTNASAHRFIHLRVENVNNYMVEKERIFNNSIWKNCMSTHRRMKLCQHLIP